MSELQTVRSKPDDVALGIDASALIVYRVPRPGDRAADRIGREAAMAKPCATETAQEVAHDAVQVLAGPVLVPGHPTERLCREIRALKAYEGTLEAQKLIVARRVLAAHAEDGAKATRGAATLLEA